MRTGIILLLILSIMLYGCKNAENEIFVLPEGYTGYILVIFDQEKGIQPKYFEDSRLYEVPQNGILKSIHTTNDGWTDFPMFYYQEVTRNKQIPFVTSLDNVPTDEIVAYGGTSGSIKKSADSEERIRFIKFYVGTKPQIEQAQHDLNKLNILKLAE